MKKRLEEVLKENKGSVNKNEMVEEVNEILTCHYCM